MADAWVISPGWPPDLIEEKLGLYFEALEELGRREHVSEVVLRRDVHLSQSAERARHEARELLEGGYRGFGQKEIEESLIVSGPEGCVGYLKRMQGMGVTHVLFRCALDQREKALQTIRLLGTEVIPQVR